VQVGIFSTRENAQRYTEKLAQEGLKCTLFEKAVNDRTFYAVSAGMFVDREEAENFALSLKQRSINCFVVKK
jgi:Sporulation related domain.